MIIIELQQFINSLVRNSLQLVDYRRIAKLFTGLKGNAKYMNISQFNWAIPLAWLGFFGPIYMSNLGLSKMEIGLLTSLGFGLQTLNIMMGGYFAEKMGHKKTVMLFDFIGWPFSMLIFAFAQNVWWFVAGTVILQLSTIASASWPCLFVEHTHENKRAKAYAVFQLVNTVAGFTVPIAGLLTDSFGETRGIRIMYLLASLSTAAGVFYRIKYVKDTEVSLLNRKFVNLHFDFRKEFIKFRQGFKKLQSRNRLFIYFIVQALVGFGYTMWGAFAVLFWTDPKGMGLPQSSITVFPAISTTTTIIFTLLAIPLIKEKDYRKTFVLILLAPIAAAMLYLTGPKGALSFIVVATTLNAIFSSFYNPFMASYILNILPDKERSRTISVVNTLFTLIYLPAGALAGWLFTIHPKILFAFCANLFVIAWIIVFFRFRYEKKRKQAS